jgi:hypothetical protein
MARSECPNHRKGLNSPCKGYHRHDPTLASVREPVAGSEARGARSSKNRCDISLRIYSHAALDSSRERKSVTRRRHLVPTSAQQAEMPPKASGNACRSELHNERHSPVLAFHNRGNRILPTIRTLDNPRQQIECQGADQEGGLPASPLLAQRQGITFSEFVTTRLFNHLQQDWSKCSVESGQALL